MNINNPIIYEPESEIDFKKIYLSLKKGKKLIFLISIISVLISIIYVFFIAKPIYTSETKLILLNSSSNTSTISGIANQFGFSIPSMTKDDNAYLSSETLPEILHSRTLAKTLLYTEFNSQLFGKPRYLLNIISKSHNYSFTDSNKLITIATNQILNNMLDLKQIKTSPVYYLNVDSFEPQLSADIAHVVVKKLEDLQSEFSQLQIKKRKIFISNRLEEIQTELFQGETKLKNFREQNLQLNLSPSLLLIQEQLQREIQVQTNVFISLKEQFEKIKIEEAENISVLKIVDPPNIPIRHSKPKRKMIVILIGLTSLMVGGIIAIIKNYGKIN